jgi:hypothetical protein
VQFPRLGSHFPESEQVVFEEKPPLVNQKPPKHQNVTVDPNVVA